MHRLHPEHRDFARSLRSEPTDAERRLWSRLRGKQLHGARFRRQHPVGPYVLDFVCLEAMLVVEVDGGQHADRLQDVARDALLSEKGFRVIRFWNNEVLANTDGVVERVLEVLGRFAPPPQPSPLQGEGVAPSPSQGDSQGEGWGGGAASPQRQPTIPASAARAPSK